MVQLQDSVVDEILDPGRQKWRPYGGWRDGTRAVPYGVAVIL